MLVIACGSDNENSCGDGEIAASARGVKGCYKKCETKADCAATQECTGDAPNSICLDAAGNNEDPDVGGDDTDDNNANNGGPSEEDRQLCQDYCHLIYGCIEDTCDTSGLISIAAIEMECVSGDPLVASDNGCYGDMTGPQAAQYRADRKSFVYSDGVKLTCADTEWLRCGIIAGLKGPCGCEAPSNLGAACTDDSQCEGGSLFPFCIPETATQNGQTQQTGYIGGYCVAEPCPLIQNAEVGEVNRNTQTNPCGANSGCFYAQGPQGNPSGQCRPTCTSHDSCRDGYSCQIMGGEKAPAVGGADPVITPVRSCLPECSATRACPAESRCNEATNGCEFKCTTEASRGLCTRAGGTCTAGTSGVFGHHDGDAGHADAGEPDVGGGEPDVGGGEPDVGADTGDTGTEPTGDEWCVFT